MGVEHLSHISNLVHIQITSCPVKHRHINVGKVTAWKRSWYICIFTYAKRAGQVLTDLLSVSRTFNRNLRLSSCSNCTGRGRGWPCCVPNYLRTFPKIATETSLLVRDVHTVVYFCWLVYSNMYQCSHSVRLLLFSTCLQIILPLLVSFCRLPLQMMPHGSFWKAQMTTSMQITSMWVSSASLYFFFHLSIIISAPCSLVAWWVVCFANH